MSIFDQLLETTGIDFGTAQRGVQPMKEAVKKMSIEDLSELAKVYGGLDKIPDSLKAFNTTQEGGIKKIDSRFNIKGLGKDEELRLLPGTDSFGKEGKYYVSKKDAPKLGGLGSVAGGIVDTITLQNTDLDRLGTDFGAKPKIVDINNPSNYLVSQAQKSAIANALEQAGVDTGLSETSNPLGNAEAQLNFLEKNADRIDKLYRDRAKGAAFDEFLNYTLTEPARRKNLEKARAIAINQDIQAQLAKQALPNELQSRLLAADSGFAQKAAALAGQADAASRMAAVGVFPRNVGFSV
tara:strand:+ start:5290 stop:6177 length:888 start_codon:yes stop_codon:yes gene_type:complete